MSGHNLKIKSDYLFNIIDKKKTSEISGYNSAKKDYNQLTISLDEEELSRIIFYYGGIELDSLANKEIAKFIAANADKVIKIERFVQQDKERK